MAWKPIPPDEWSARAEADFWEPYGRKRAGQPKAQMVKKQLSLLMPADPNSALALASKLGLNKAESAQVRILCLQTLADAAEETGEIDTAIDHMLEWAKLDEFRGLPPLINLLCTYERPDRAAETIAVVEAFPPKPDSYADYGAADLNMAVLLALVGDREQAVQLANKGFDAYEAAQHRSRYGGMTRTSTFRGIDRALFALVQRGGAPRFAGLLGEDSKVTPETLTATLKNNVYFKRLNLAPSADRLIVDLEEFSLDFRWISDPKIIANVQQHYQRFKFEDRRHIPNPPESVEKVLVVLAIGDDASLPDIVNPLIELVGDLDQFGECIFYDRVGPLSRRDDLEEFVPATTSDIDKVMRAKIKPLFAEAQFESMTTRRFILRSGPLGYAAGVFFKIEKPRMRVMASLQIYYRELLEEGALDRYLDEKGVFQPKALHHDNTRCYLFSYHEWTPNDPSLETVSSLFDTIAGFLQDEWLPLIERTRDPMAELAWIKDNLEEVGENRLFPSKNRFGVKTKRELAVEMAKLLDVDFAK